MSERLTDMKVKPSCQHPKIEYNKYLREWYCCQCGAHIKIADVYRYAIGGGE